MPGKTPRHTAQSRPLRSHIVNPSHPSIGGSVDGISQPVKKLSVSSIQLPRTPALLRQYNRRPEVKLRSTWRNLLELAFYPVIAAVVVTAAYNLVIGRIMITLYVVLLVLAKLTSQYSFGAALLYAIAAIGFHSVHQPLVTEHCAIYACSFVVLGLLQILIAVIFHKHKQFTHSISPTS
jgi:hypothetical protein